MKSKFIIKPQVRKLLSTKLQKSCLKFQRWMLFSVLLIICHFICFIGSIDFCINKIPFIIYNYNAKFKSFTGLFLFSEISSKVFDCGEGGVILCVGWLHLMRENCGDVSFCQLVLFSLLGISLLLWFQSFCHLLMFPSFLQCKMTGN